MAVGCYISICYLIVSFCNITCIQTEPLSTVLINSSEGSSDLQWKIIIAWRLRKPNGLDLPTKINYISESVFSSSKSHIEGKQY